MTEDQLRQACEKFANEYLDDNIMKEHDGLYLLLAFAKQMHAEGLRMASRQARVIGKPHTRASENADIYAHYEAGCQQVAIWCEAEAKKLEAS